MAKQPKSKTLIRFNADPHHILEADGKTIFGGGEDTIDLDTALVLAHNHAVHIEILDKSAPKWPSTSEALDQVAKQLGFSWPEPADGQAGLSVTEKQAALDDAYPTAPAEQPAAEEKAAAEGSIETPIEEKE